MDHVASRIGRRVDVARAAKFYDAVLGALGYKRVMEFLPHALAYGEDHPEFWSPAFRPSRARRPPATACISASRPIQGQVHKFHELALKHGGSNNGEPGPRPDYGPDYYGAFIYDLDGNKIEATLHNPPKARTQAAKKPAKKAARKAVKKKVAKKAVKKKAKKKARR